MAEDSLVDTSIAKAERILPRLPERGIEAVAAFVAFEIESDQWMLLVATSKGAKDESKLAFYGAVQSAANELDIDVNLGQVVQVRQPDISVDPLRAAAMAQRHARSYPPVEFGAWLFTNVHEVNIASWHNFQIQVIDAVHSIAHPDWRLTLSAKSKGQPVDIDILIENNGAKLAVETKQYRLTDSTAIMTTLGKQRLLQQYYPKICVLLISKNGFSASALATAKPFKDFRLVSWEYIQAHGPGELEAAVSDLLAAG
jgi:hypothetical protein